ncbi:helix-turn-helix domain-containing protein [Streptomyces apocyni]|uniref:helix-turn-helix domain-containing protein n=1 Tax=Streptomyces apocyni TaxID=2654677 RepID=UPI001E3B105C|nr:helix-turn-helix transcriptional regulator [Streptomyces apocyni]
MGVGVAHSAAYEGALSMAQPKSLDPYTNPRSFYGAELRRKREEMGWSQEQLGAKAFCSGAYIGQFESATRRPQPDLSRLFDGEFGTGEHFQRLCRLARKSKHADYFADAAELEKLAKTISEYAPMLVPGLLQTEAYARAVTQVTLPYADPHEIAELVQLRTERQRILGATTGPLLWAVLHETVIRVPMGGRDVMGGQLRHLVNLGRTPLVVLQVLPFAASAEAFINGMTSLLTFSDAPAVVYAEGAGSGQLIEDPGLVEQYQRSYDRVRAAALSPEASLGLLESAAEEHSTP